MEESKGCEGLSHAPVISKMSPANTNPGLGGNDDVPQYELCAVLTGHTGDVRSLAAGARGTHLYSGGRDKKVMAWELDESGRMAAGIHETPAAEVSLPDWVNALTVRECGKELVVAGCSDGVLYAIELQEDSREEGTGGGGSRKRASLVVEKTLIGHEAPVCSLSWSAEGLLLSGSWDETARCWDLDTSTCKWVLGGHENNVCVLGLSPGYIATGSTGLRVDGRLVGQQIRMWEGLPPKEFRSLTDHASGIRDLCKTAGSSNSDPSVAFCSASNDGTVRAWSASGDCRGIFTIPDESFVFSVRALSEGLMVSGDDAGNLCAFRLPPPDAASPPPTRNASVLYKHLKTVWSVTALPPPSGAGAGGDVCGTETPRLADVVTGSADHAVRVFTPDPKRALRGGDLKAAKEAAGGRVDTRECLAGGSEHSFSSSLPSVSEMSVMVGEEDGQLSAFVDDGGDGGVDTARARVFRWVEAFEGSAGKWESLGTLRPPRRKVVFEGGLYDKVIPVEVDSASRGLLFFQLGVNHEDDPKAVASAFCEKHSLGAEYLPQVEQFLLLAAL